MATCLARTLAAARCKNGFGKRAAFAAAGFSALSPSSLQQALRNFAKSRSLVVSAQRIAACKSVVTDTLDFHPLKDAEIPCGVDSYLTR
jgi:hypothetical protein